MDVKRYDWVTSYEDGHTHMELGRTADGNYVLYDDIKHLLTRPDPAEVEHAP